MKHQAKIMETLQELRRLYRTMETTELEATQPDDVIGVALSKVLGGAREGEAGEVSELTMTLLQDTASAALSQSLKKMLPADEVLERYFVEFGRQGFVSMVSDLIGQVANA